MSSSHSLIRMLSEFELRVRELSTALALEASRRSPLAAPNSPCTPRVSALRLACARRLWFLEPVPAQAFLHAGNRVATIAVRALQPILAARALFACRDAIRRCVDRQTKRALSLGIGPTAFAALQELALTSTSGRPLPDDLTVEALARLGWTLMLADGACANATLRRMVELGLALSSGDDIWQNVLASHRNTLLQASAIAADGATRGGSDKAAATGTNATDEFLSIAGLLFPEFQWLFG
ncbi:MAG TPA: type III secretion protein HrpB4 [Trinickia sp.]|uniref:type III secretion protein HrpB4 n=1 Tax=Trinickia sp. TaxID=2571163 RepID=UPI002C8EFCBB|nr:type III secretion protein HrpB4 [Trinickia sp.]HVW50453.1 type III secretion protein HrpB4 [Trinickia sp.]